MKAAARQMLKILASRQTRERTLRAGVYTFGNYATRVYPGHQEAGADFNAALSAVGARPSGPLDGETGIQPIVGRLSDDPRGNGNTDFDTAMATLARDYLTASPGDGKTAAAPRKILVLITDGFDDASTPTRFSRAAFNPESCDGFKRRGYEVIVLDVPY